jgi:acyl phosphate:glycerol-3-phosphate acyltransferase
MSTGLFLTGFLFVTFFFAGIPIGFLIVKAVKGIDIRTTGSGNIGATNVKRLLGTSWFITVLLLDALKGAIPGAMAIIFSDFFGFGPLQLALIALFTILGNVFSPYLNFKGGKGVATAIGALGVLSPLALLFSLILFLIVILVTNYVSLGSMIAAIGFPFFVILAGKILMKDVSIITVIFCSLIAIVIVIMHKKNIIRLVHGEENKFIKK